MSTWLDWQAVAVGDAPPAIELEVSLLRATMHVGAGRDFMRDHYDVEHARAGGHPTIFVNTFFHQSLADRLVTDWAGPRARLMRRQLRMLAPLYVGSRARASGVVAACRPLSAAEGCIELDIVIEADGRAVSRCRSHFALPLRAD